MIKCQGVCKRSFPKLPLVTTRTKTVSHPPRKYKHRKKEIEDKGGTGSQIVRQLYLCSSCKVLLVA